MSLKFANWHETIRFACQCQASNDESHNDDPEAQKSNGREDTDKDGKAVDEEELVEL